MSGRDEDFGGPIDPDDRVLSWSLVDFARDVAEDVCWSGDLGELIRAALTFYALSACEAGRCTHATCNRRPKIARAA